MREAAFFIASQSNPASAGALPVLLGKARAAFRAWRNRRRVSCLIHFDDHMLRDIGLTREDVRWALDLPFASDPAYALQRRALRSRQQGWRERS